MVSKKTGIPPTKETKPTRSLGQRFMGLFTPEISEKNIRRLLVERKLAELVELARKYVENPEKLDRIATIIYEIIKKIEDPEIAGRPREIGLEVRAAILRKRLGG